MFAHFRSVVIAGALAAGPAYAAADVLTKISRAKHAMATGKHDEAIQHITRVIESGEASRSQLGALFAIRCSVYVTIGEDDLAIDDCTEALRLDDAGEFVPLQSSLAHLSRCISYLIKESYNRAIEDCTAVIDMKGVDVPTPTMRAKAFSGLCASHAGNGSYEQAIEDCTVAIELAGTGALETPLLALVYSARCESYLGIAVYEPAIVDCTTSVDLDEHQYAYRERGWAHYSLGHLEDAIADFDRALAIAPNDETAHFRRALAAYGAGKFDDANHEFSWLSDVNGSYAYYAI